MNNNIPNFALLFRQAPKAVARVKGSDEYPEIGGNVWFYQFNYGVLVVADIMGLPTSNFFCKNPIYAFHIHEGETCTGNEEDLFADAKMHYNPDNCAHPYHAGDLPPLFSANGFAFLAVLVNRFTIDEVIGRTIIIHSSVDDFVTQPSGNAGTKIACGKIITFS